MSYYIRGVWLGGYIMLFGLMGLQCANDGKREAWQECAGVYHEECVGPDFQACEYEYYKVCING